MKQTTKQIGFAVIAGALAIGGIATATTPVEAASKSVQKDKPAKKSAKQVKADKALGKTKAHFKKYKLGKPFDKPVSGKITNPHGERKSPFGVGMQFHEGVDIAAKKGVAVKASYTGKIVEASSNEILGKHVVIEHELKGETFKTTYAHLDKYNVKVGQTVKQGRVIGKVGKTGRATGEHLHFEIEDEMGVSIDPEEIME